MDLVKAIENQRFDDGTLGISFVKIINAIGHHFNHTTAEVAETGITRNVVTGDTNIKISANATAKEILVMLKGETNTDISDFGRRLKDIGILLSREEVVKNSKAAREFARSVYLVGCITKNENISIISKYLLRFNLKALSLSNESQEYKDELFLWAIGRDNPDSKYARNLHNDKRPHSLDRDYTGDQLTQEQRALKSQRSENTLRHKSLLLKKFVEGLERRKGELPKETRIGLEWTFISAARQAVINILTKNAWKNWEHNLKIPPTERHKYFDNEILKIFEKIPGFQDESLRIVTAVEELTKSERWKILSDIEKVRDIWDVCQTYKYAETYSPTAALENREFECQLKSFLSGNLIKKFVPETKIATWYEERHTKLAIQIKNGTNYMFDANLSKEANSSRNISVTDNDSYYDHYGIGITIEINKTINRFFETNIEQIIPTEKMGYMSVGDFDKTIVAGILSNLALDKFIPDKDMQIAILRLAIEINPNYAGAYINLGNLLSGEEAIRMYRKAIELNPNYARAYFNLGSRLEGEEAVRMYRKAIEIDPNFVEAFFNLSIEIFYNQSLQTKEHIKEGLSSIGKFLELAKDNPDSNNTDYFKVYAPAYKAFFEKKLAGFENREI